MELSKQGPVPSRIFVASLSYVIQSLAHFQSKYQMRSRQRCQLFHKRALLANGLFFLPWCTSCTFDHDCPHHLFPGCKIRLFLLFQYPSLSFFFGMHSGQEEDPLVFLCSNGQQSEIVCMVKCVLNCSFTAFAKKLGGMHALFFFIVPAKVSFRDFSSMARGIDV